LNWDYQYYWYHSWYHQIQCFVSLSLPKNIIDVNETSALFLRRRSIPPVCFLLSLCFNVMNREKNMEYIQRRIVFFHRPHTCKKKWYVFEKTKMGSCVDNTSVDPIFVLSKNGDKKLITYFFSKIKRPSRILSSREHIFIMVYFPWKVIITITLRGKRVTRPLYIHFLHSSIFQKCSFFSFMKVISLRFVYKIFTRKRIIICCMLIMMIIFPEGNLYLIRFGNM